MIQVDGSASLTTRRNYLKRRRTGRLGVIATWTGVGALLIWLSVMGLFGLAH
jgi:hypothetical protein